MRGWKKALLITGIILSTFGTFAGMVGMIVIGVIVMAVAVWGEKI